MNYNNNGEGTERLDRDEHEQVVADQYYNVSIKQPGGEDIDKKYG